jgi:hypothetical protein
VYRFGARWTAERLAGTREPALRAHARGPRIELIDAGRGEEARIREALGANDPACPASIADSREIVRV